MTTILTIQSALKWLKKSRKKEFTFLNYEATGKRGTCLFSLITKNWICRDGCGYKWRVPFHNIFWAKFGESTITKRQAIDRLKELAK